MWHRLKWWFYRIRGKLWARPLLYVSLAIAAVVAAGGADRLFDPEAVPEIDRETLDALMDASHHMGTARMAADPSRGVVDADCRVFGVDNLYVASSAVFPTAHAYSPTYTILALARRVAAHIHASWARARSPEVMVAAPDPGRGST